MNKVWILIADDMSAAQVAGVAAKTGVPFEALVFGGGGRIWCREGGPVRYR